MVASIGAASLRAAYRSGVRAWPDVRVDRDAFDARVREAAKHAPLAELHLDDLFLVTALERGDPRAWNAFRAAYRPGVIQALARVVRSRGAREDVADDLLAALYLPRDGADGIPLNTYSGRGALRGWVQVTAIRRVYRAARDRRRGIVVQTLVEPPPSPERDPAERACDAELFESLEAALRHGIDALPEQSRTMLQLRYQRRYSLDELGRIYGQDKSTLSKRLKALAAQLRSAIDRHLEEEAGVRVADLEDVWERLARVAPEGLDRWLGAGA